MLHVAVRAYYDQYGEFDYITETFMGPAIKKEAETANISIKEYCYRALGVKSDEIYTAEERMKRRSIAANDKEPKYLELFPDKKAKKSLLKATGIKPKFTRKSTGFTESYRDIVEAITNFIEHTDMLALEDKTKGRLCPLREIFFDLKLARESAHLDSLIPAYTKIVLMLLSRAVVIEDLKHSYVAAGRIYLTHKVNNLQELAEQTCRHIGRRAITMPAEQYYFVTGNMGYYQLSNPESSDIYLQMVDIANAYKMTVKQLIEYLGFSYVNQLELWEATGYFMYEVRGSRYLCVDPLTAEAQMELDASELYRSYSSNGRIRHA